MRPLPAILAEVPEDTTVIGDLDSFMTYVTTGQAQRDWSQRMHAVTEEFEAFVHAHAHVWNHIIIPVGHAKATPAAA